MFRFESPEYLYFLIAVPLLVLLFALNMKKRRKLLCKLGSWENLKPLLANVSEKRMWIKFSLLASALFFLIISLARPQLGTRQKTDVVTGIEVVVALDVSNSMLAQDVTPTRLDKAKQIVSSLCNRLHNDKIALVVFAGNAFLQVPISADNISVKMFLDAVNTGTIPTQGTSIAEALSVSRRSFTAQKGVKKAVVVITDGEDHEGGEDEIVKELKDNDINVFVLGIGEAKGAPIKIGGNYLRDQEGNVVISRLNEEMCRELAKKTNGAYIHVDNSSLAQEQLLGDLNKLQSFELGTVSYSEYNELFPWFATIALLLLVAEVLVQYRKSRFSENWKRLWERSDKAKMWITLAVISFSLTTATAQSRTKVQTHKGNVAFNKKQDSLAIINYKKAIASDSTNFKAHYNLGNTYFRQGKGQDAMKEYEKSAAHTPSKLIKKAIHHNMGCVYYLTKQYDKAVESFKESLRADPKDDRVRYNLAMAQYMLKKNPKQQQQKQQQQKQQQQNKQNNNQNNNANPQSQNKNKDRDGGMSKQNTEQMLRAVQMKEQQTQEKLKHKQSPKSRRYPMKNW